jgi:predicted nucleic acid-binding protein
VVVAGLTAWHPDHAVALEVLSTRPPLIAHVVVESYAVLTRLPHDRRIAPEVALAAVRSFHSGEPLELEGRSIVDLLATLSAAGISGGATYDAVIAETARRHDVALVTLDERAMRTYDVVGVDYELLTPS